MVSESIFNEPEYKPDSLETHFTTNHTNHHELAVRKTILTFRFHEINKDQEGNHEPLVRRPLGSVEEHESFTVNIGVRVRGVRVVRGKLFEN